MISKGYNLINLQLKYDKNMFLHATKYLVGHGCSPDIKKF